MMENRSDRVRQRSMKRCELLSSSSICLAVDPRKPSGPAAVSPRFKAGYTTASAVFTIVDRNSLQDGGGPYTSFCSSRAAPISRVMLASLGKMPTTLARRLTSLFKRSTGLVECNLVRCWAGKAR